MSRNLANVKEDEAVHRAKEEIERLFLSAGYFRIRMPDIDDFDKIAGGLVWGLKGSSVDVDVNVFFKERPNVAEKIRISESICAGLAALKSPFQLKPHQVQGLDFKALFPVVQWLVKMVLATRREFGDFQRRYSCFVFNNRYSNLPADVQLKGRSLTSSTNIGVVDAAFPPRRFYRRREWDSSLAEVKQVEMTLLEYGRIPSLIPAGGKASQAKGAQREDEREREETARRDELRKALGEMKRQDGTTGLETGVVRDLVGAQADLLKAAREVFDAQAPQVRTKLTARELNATHEARMAALSQRMASAEAALQAVAGRYREEHGAFVELQEQVGGAEERNAQLKRAIARAQQTIDSSEHTEDLLRAISMKNATAKNADVFAAQCEADIREWREKIDALRERGPADGADEQLGTLLKQFGAQWDTVRVELAAKTRNLLKLRVAVDEVPTAAELTQFERRLSELAVQRDAKATEARKCTQLRDSFAGSESVLADENEFFNEVLKHFNRAVEDAKLRDSLLHKMSEMLQKITAKRADVTRDLAAKRDAVATRTEKHRKLLEQQRRYFLAVKEYTQLMEQLAALGAR